MFIKEKLYIEELSCFREITIYLPDDYQTSNKRYPVLYINDGQNAFFDDQSFLGVSWGFYDYVIKHHLEIIMVAIPCNFGENKRSDEYSPWILPTKFREGITQPIGGQGDKYGEFVAYTLKNFIDLRFPTIVSDCAIIGSSLGGIISAYIALKYPHRFNKVATLSTPYGIFYRQFEDLIVASNVDLIKVYYLDYGGKESDNQELNQLYHQSNQYFYQMLSHRYHNCLTLRYFPEAKHNEMAWRKRLDNVMELFYGGDSND